MRWTTDRLRKIAETVVHEGLGGRWAQQVPRDRLDLKALRAPLGHKESRGLQALKGSVV